MKRNRTRTARHALAAMIAGGGVLCAGAGLAQPDVPVPPKTQTAQVAKKIIYNGLDMHAKVFESRLTQQQVVNFYKQQWGKKIAVNTLQASKIVGHLDGDSFITVQVTPDGVGSKGTIGIIKLPPKGAQRPELGKGLPLPFGAKVVNDISYPDDRTPARTVLLVDRLSPGQNASFFRSRLIAAGWKDANTNRCAHDASDCALEFQRGNSTMMFVSGRVRSRSQVLMNIRNPQGG